MESNCKNKFNLDHIYCHANDNNYIRANNSSTPDVLALLKENKHLKTMLLLHLDLIQEQSDQLITKEKLIATLRDENNSLKLRLERMERRSQLRSHKNIEILPIPSITSPSVSSSSSSLSGSSVSPAIKTSGISTIAGGTTVVGPTGAVVENYDDVDDKKENIPDLSIIEPSSFLTLTSALSTNATVTHIASPSTTTLTMSAAATTITTQRQHQQNNKYKICDDTFSNDSIIGESNGKLISKIVLQRVQIPTSSSMSVVSTECGSNSLKNAESQKLNSPLTKQKQHHQNQSTLLQRRNLNIKDISNSLDINEYQNQISIKSEPENQDVLESSISTIPIAELKNNNNNVIEQDNEQMLDLSLSSNLNQRKRRRLGFMTTKNAYYTREWEDERQIVDDTNKEEVEALKAEEPNLEIPKWTIKEFTGLYSIEGTEDLSDDVFSKRHSKLEYDEKRRKKWDVQRIREQRTIERLRRRHYKDELLQQESQDNQEMTTFFPTVDQIKFIQITEDLPVQAFGDCIPRIIPPIEFCLPWREHSSVTSVFTPLSTSSLSAGLNTFSLSTSATTTVIATTTTSSSHQQQQQSFDSVDSSGTTFIFLKKKRRAQSQGVSSGNSKKPRKLSK